jgi:hypothetical protein
MVSNPSTVQDDRRGGRTEVLRRRGLGLALSAAGGRLGAMAADPGGPGQALQCLI